MTNIITMPEAVKATDRILSAASRTHYRHRGVRRKLHVMPSEALAAAFVAAKLTADQLERIASEMDRAMKPFGE